MAAAIIKITERHLAQKNGLLKNRPFFLGGAAPDDPMESTRHLPVPGFHFPGTREMPGTWP